MSDVSPVPRLSRADLPPSRPPELIGPIERPHALGIVHLGLGAFSRAHQARYTEVASQVTGDRQWGILGVTGRTPDVVHDLAPQGCVYGVLVRSGDEASVQLTGSVIDVAAVTEEDKVIAAIADPAVRVITLTITEKAYASPISAPIALLCSGLRRRFESGGAPITVVSCDNVVGNGRVLESLVVANVEGHDFVTWLASSVRFPRTMVDRIVPATTEDDRALAERISGRFDAGLVVAERFTQWVIEDDFAGDRPRWELAGATFVDDVSPFEAAKLRILNGAHSLLAYSGSLAGYATISQAAGDLRLADMARELHSDARRTLVRREDLDLEHYSERVLERFRDPGLRHSTHQVAMDGSQKLPGRIVGTIADSLSLGVVPIGGAFAVAAWIAYLLRASRTASAHGDAVLPSDPMSAELHELLVGAELESRGAVRALLGLHAVFPPEVAASSPLQSLIVEFVDDLLEGARPEPST